MKKQLCENKCCRWVVSACAMMVMLTAVCACAGETGSAEVKIDHVALFKNGMGYFNSSAVLPKDATTVNLGQLPVASHGTFWVSYPEGVKIGSLITSMADVEKTVPAGNITQLLKGNIGREVSLTTSIEALGTVKGVVVNVIPDDKQDDQPCPYRMGPVVENRRIPYPGEKVVVVKTKEGIITLSASAIMRADFEGADINMSVPVTSKQPSIKMELEKAAPGKTVGISYLARGIAWAPSYIIDLSDAENAKLSAKAVVINEVADLKEVALDLVTGFPNIQFGNVASPVAMTQSLEEFLKALAGDQQPRGGHREMMMNQQRSMSGMMGADFEMPPVPQYPTPQEGTISEDLFLYPVAKFSLLRGETATIPLFTAEVPYKHIYMWKIPNAIDENERYRGGRDGNEQVFTEEVWHCCRLVNNMKMPWTTAAAEFVTNGQITGQDVCYYTSPGAETTIRINRAMNVEAESAEMELERKRSAAEFYGSRYDLVKVKGQLELHNRMDKAIKMEVTKSLSGEVLDTLPEAKDTADAKGLKRVNPSHVLVWKIDLAAGDEQTLSYTYEVYVHN
jgi:hypothetical protein